MTETNEKRQTGYIYSIRSYQTELIYIGSTFGPLRQRLFQHKYNFKQFNLQKFCYISSYEIIKYNDAYVELVETYENVNKMELRRFEGQHIRQNKCVNKLIAGQTKKEHYETNKDKISENMKEYYEINKNKILEKYLCACNKSLNKCNKSRHDKICKALTDGQKFK